MRRPKLDLDDMFCGALAVLGTACLIAMGLLACRTKPAAISPPLPPEYKPPDAQAEPAAKAAGQNPCLGHNARILTNGSAVLLSNTVCGSLVWITNNPYQVTEFQFRGRLGPHQFATNVMGPWSAPATNSYIWKWSGPYPRCNQMYFRAPPGAVNVTSYWTTAPVPEVSYIANL
jgi:hypothetical protein